MGKYWESKKYPNADLNRIRPLLFSISLTITMLIIIGAFEWKSANTIDTTIKVRSTEEFEELMEVPPTVIPPPPAPSVQVASIVEVPDTEEIEEEVRVVIDIDITEQTVSQQFTIQEPPKMEEEEVEKIFLVVEQPAAPRDGMAAFYKDIGQRIIYPAPARRMGVEGKVFVEFVVERDGSLTQFQVVKGIGAGCDEEAVRVIREAPSWVPGKQRGKPVRQRMVLPIHFILAR
jgi:periplasmic protein TonB